MSEDNKILFAGDPHGDFAPLISAVLQYKPEAVVLLGDYELKKPFEEYLQEILDKTQVFWIPGNHDFEPAMHYDNLFQSQLMGQCLHLQVRDVAGVRIAGLGGIFLGRVWYPPNKPKWRNKQQYLSRKPLTDKATGLSLKYESAIWPDEWEALKSLKADILVTHEAPRSHKYGFIAIDQLAEAMGVRKVFHGHLHEHYSARIRKGIEVYGVGDAKVADLLGNEV